MHGWRSTSLRCAGAALVSLAGQGGRAGVRACRRVQRQPGLAGSCRRDTSTAGRQNPAGASQSAARQGSSGTARHPRRRQAPTWPGYQGARAPATAEGSLARPAAAVAFSAAPTLARPGPSMPSSRARLSPASSLAQQLLVAPDRASATCNAPAHGSVPASGADAGHGGPWPSCLRCPLACSSERSPRRHACLLRLRSIARRPRPRYRRPAGLDDLSLCAPPAPCRSAKPVPAVWGD